MANNPSCTLLDGLIDGTEFVKYLPIEALRGDGAKACFRQGVIEKTFRSSGTTTQDRSLSHFSAVGLAQYQQQSIKRFAFILDQVQPLDKSESRLGLSLVPDQDAWPESSLAQMLSWIASIYEVRFVSEGELTDVIAANIGRPLWLFGTAFHWVNVLDSGSHCTLAPGSVIFETGGTKGRTREVSRSHLYQELSHAFRINTEAIVSEYGMSELSCQAYDYVPHGRILELDNRRFRFAPDVDVAVLGRPGAAYRKGRGALMVRDPARTDYPWYFRTEDLVELENGAFRLLGRAPKAALKGCSLGAERALVPVTRDSNSHDFPLVSNDHKAPLAAGHLSAGRIAALSGHLRDFCSDREVIAALSEELGSSQAATIALQDLTDGMPGDFDGWVKAVTVALGNLAGTLQKWLVILPENHSLVGLYPLSIGYLAGLNLTVRQPSMFQKGRSPLSLFLTGLASLPEARLSILPPQWRIMGVGETLPFDAILSYGTSETVDKIQSLTNLPVRGFGHRIAVSIIPITATLDQVDRVTKDCLGLGQLGCMSSRLICVAGKEGGKGSLKSLIQSLQSSGQKFWSKDFPWRQMVSLDFEHFRQANLGAEVFVPPSTAHPLVCLTKLPNLGELEGLENALAQNQFCLSVAAIDTQDIPEISVNIAKYLSDRRNLGTLTVPFSVLNQTQELLLRSGLSCHSVRPLGEANAPKWDGLHEGIPLFDPSLREPIL